MDVGSNNAAQGKTHQAIDRMSEAAHQTVNRLASSAGPAADWLKGSGSRLKEAQNKMMTETSDYVRQHPLAAVGVAIAAGFLIGKLTQSRGMTRE